MAWPEWPFLDASVIMSFSHLSSASCHHLQDRDETFQHHLAFVLVSGSSVETLLPLLCCSHVEFLRWSSLSLHSIFCSAFPLFFIQHISWHTLRLAQVQPPSGGFFELCRQLSTFLFVLPHCPVCISTYHISHIAAIIHLYVLLSKIWLLKGRNSVLLIFSSPVTN